MTEPKIVPQFVEERLPSDGLAKIMGPSIPIITRGRVRRCSREAAPGCNNHRMLVLPCCGLSLKSRLIQHTRDEVPEIVVPSRWVFCRFHFKEINIGRFQPSLVPRIMVHGMVQTGNVPKQTLNLREALQGILTIVCQVDDEDRTILPSGR